MHPTVCPTVTADSFESFNLQAQRLANFAVRVHIDVADGSLTPNELIPIDQIWWPGGVRADIHVMYRRPLDHLDALVALQPQLVILHAEAEGSFNAFADRLHRHGIEAGVALLQDTPIEVIKPALPVIDHVLVFSGTLGSYGGTVDLSLLDKVAELKRLKPQLEIGWDGGINDQNIRQLAEGGVEVLNVGGFIQKSDQPQAAYAILESKLEAL
jgi:ribulose-phosphate 3-epimerase